MRECHNAPHILTARSRDGRKELADAASTYFIHQLNICKRRGRLPTNEDLHTWVYGFVCYNIKMGRIDVALLVDEIIPMTEILWEIAVDEMMSYTEDMSS